MTAGITKYKGKLNLKFVTFTSSYQSNKKLLNDHHEEIIRRIRHSFDSEAQYFKIKTDEGNGVIHNIIACKLYIPQSWLSRNWDEIHSAPIVYTEKLYYGKGLKNYLIPYLQSQGTRISQSRNWFRPGWTKQYQRFLTDKKTSYIFLMRKERGHDPPIYCVSAFQRWFYRSLVPILFWWWLVENVKRQTPATNETILDFKALMLEKLCQPGQLIIQGADSSIL